MDKICPRCGRNLCCVFTGATAYLEKEEHARTCDLFGCFHCDEYFVFGMPSRGEEVLDKHINVIVPRPYDIIPYPNGSGFSWVRPEPSTPTILLPSAVKYISDKCHHVEEMNRYIERRPEPETSEAEE